MQCSKYMSQKIYDARPGDLVHIILQPLNRVHIAATDSTTFRLETKSTRKDNLAQCLPENA